MQTGAVHCASGNKHFTKSNIATVYHDKSNPAYPAKMHLDSKGNLFIMYSDIDRYELGKIKLRNTRTTIVRCKASIVEGTVCDANKARTNLFEMIGLRGVQHYQPENVYEDDPQDHFDL